MLGIDSTKAYRGILLSFLIALAGCSSATKQSEPGMLNVDEPGTIAADSGKEAIPPPGMKEPLVEKSRGWTLDAKYKPLSQAVRAGKSSAIIEEAGKILATNADDPVALNTLALYHMRRGQVGAAKLLLSRALEKNQSNAALYNNLGVVLLEEGDTVGALLNLKKAMRIDDEHVETLGNLGSIYVRSGDASKALPLLEKAYKANRGNAALGTNYAIALRVSKDYSRSAKVYEEVLAKNSRDPSALINYASLMIEYMNKPKDGLALVYKVKFIETENREIINRANALEKKAKSELK